MDESDRLSLYRLQVEARYFEDRAYELFHQNLLNGPCHLATGQEAVSAGFGAAMDKRDYTFCTYRGHHHALARGVSMVSALGEMMGRQCGLLGGNGGSMHLTSVEHGLMGCYAIVGAHLPIATGAALSAKYRKSGQVTVCFFGDGATNIGAFHEALNLAAVWALPIVYVCENNQYAEYTPIGAVTPVANPAADRAGAYSLQSLIVDGNDADEVFRIAGSTLNACRSGEGPVLVEAKTYRQRGHGSADPAKYRPKEELAAWLERDPISLYRKRLLDLGISRTVLEEIEGKAREAIDEATKVARASPLSADELASRNVWANGGASWRN